MKARLPRLTTLAATALLLAVTGALALFTAQIVQELDELRESPRDNVQWSLSQLEVETLVLANTVHAARQGAASLGKVRRRFDILYSRADIVSGGSVFAILRTDDRTAADLDELHRRLETLVPVIDGDDTALRAALPRLAEGVEALRPLMRQIALDGVRIFAVRSDAKRAAFADLLMQTASIALGLIAVLAVLVLAILRQKRVADDRASALKTLARRFERTIEASLDAVIMADGDGRVVEFNGAAERTFGYTKEEAIGADLGALIVPPKHREAHANGMRRYRETGEARMLGNGRVELDAMRSTAEEFPAELSLSTTCAPEGPLFIAYVRDITARRRAHAELKEARDKALAAARAKSEFLAVMSHEMRTPLNGVLAILDLLKDTPLDERQRRFLETAITSGELLQHRIDDVLDINRIEAGRLALDPQPFMLEALLEEIARINGPAAETRDNTITVATGGGETCIVADRHRIGQIVLNLVGNAVKFTEGGRIEITARVEAQGDQGFAELSVTDNGIGIAETDRERIFEDFVTLDPSYSRTASGYGLGLGICRRIVEAMGGRIGVDSAPGRGSRFMVRVPVRAASPEEAARIRPRDGGDRGRAADDAPQADAAAPAPCARRVLLVEDNETNRFAAREMLERHGCTVTEARDGMAGVAAAERARFDLILMDISMPRLDGIEAARRIRSGTGSSRDVPIVALTAHAMPQELERVRDAGMQDLIVKPLRARSLATLLDGLGAGLHGADPFGTHLLAHEAGTGEARDPVACAVGDDLVDRAVLRELAAVLPPADMARRLRLLHGELEALADDLARIWADGDLGGVRDRAHATKGSAAIFGAVRLCDVLGTLEDACAEGEVEFVTPLIEESRLAARETLDALRPPGPSWTADRPPRGTATCLAE